MELLSNNDYIVLKQNQYTLWCSRNDASIRPLIVTDSNSFETFCCHGIVYGLIGVFQTDKLLLIKQRQLIGVLPPNHDVFNIQRIVVISLTTNDNLEDLSLDSCKNHCTKQTNNGNEHSNNVITRDTQHSSGVQKTWNQIKWTASQVKPRVVNRTNQSDTKDKCEKRILDELYKMFNETESFYYSLTADLTNSLQRQQKQNVNDKNVALWKRVDDRFFWNKVMLKPLIECNNDIADVWIVPIIQGYVKIEDCFIDISSKLAADSHSLEDVRSPVDENNQETFTMILISRRSRFRAGTRYKRRGVDEMGKCANYVETEQIFKYGSYIVSFVIVRGSVPIFWSQIGHKYRPPPKIDRNEAETQIAFNKHFAEEFDIYNSVAIINLVEHTGREKVINDSYLNHVLNFDSPNITYVSFDFHEYCRGMKFENVSIIIENLRTHIKNMRYCWIDKDGMICEQKGVFRVNCIDCLDRTNIVMTAIARTVMDTQFVRLGLLPPEGQLPTNCRRIFQVMWANNGDTISRQYAGTVALKGDFTRTGERKITGLVKDGYNSANRYYMNRFKDAYRQATIDIMQGNPISDDLSSPENDNAVDSGINTYSDQEQHERVKLVIEDCKKILIPEDEVILGGWPLVDADPINDSVNEDMDSVLVLTKDSFYCAEYDDETDRIVKYQKILLEDLEKIEIGNEPNQIFSMKSNHNYCIRFHYLINGLSGYFLMFRSTNTRFFNNMAIPIRNSEESLESLKAICESFKVALCVKSLNVPIYEGKLDRRKSKIANFPAATSSDNQSHDILKVGPLTRNISDGHLLNLKNVGSRAITNVYSRFNRLKGKWSANDKQRALQDSSQNSSLTTVLFNVESSCEDDSEDEDSLRKLRKTRIQDQQNRSLIGIHSTVERTLSSDYSECSDVEEQEMVMQVIEKHDKQVTRNRVNSDQLLESCGILATSPPLKDNYCDGIEIDSEGMIVRSSDNCILNEVDDFILDAMKKASLRQLQRKISYSQTSLSSQSQQELRTSFPSTPQIYIDDSSKDYHYCFEQSSDIGCNKKISKSSDDLESSRKQLPNKSSSNCSYEPSGDLSYSNASTDYLNTCNTKMKTSHSETAIQEFSSSGLSLSLPNPLSSPIVIKKDLLLSPLSRIAKGVQHLGINIKSGTVGQTNTVIGVSHQQMPCDAESKQLFKRKCESKSNIIEL